MPAFLGIYTSMSSRTVPIFFRTPAFCAHAFYARYNKYRIVEPMRGLPPRLQANTFPLLGVSWVASWEHSDTPSFRVDISAIHGVSYLGSHVFRSTFVDSYIAYVKNAYLISVIQQACMLRYAVQCACQELHRTPYMSLMISPFSWNTEDSGAATQFSTPYSHLPGWSFSVIIDFRQFTSAYVLREYYSKIEHVHRLHGKTVWISWKLDWKSPLSGKYSIGIVPWE